jgi:spore germination protein YaaH
MQLMDDDASEDEVPEIVQSLRFPDIPKSPTNKRKLDESDTIVQLKTSEKDCSETDLPAAVLIDLFKYHAEVTENLIELQNKHKKVKAAKDGLQVCITSSLL